MTILEWQGEIGWELWLADLKRQLKDTKGDDITVRFSTIGGSIFEGGDIFSMLSDHRRDNPNIQMILEIKAIAASMGSAVAASPVWNEITIESISLFMIHNPSSFAFGDFQVMRDNADFLESARDIWATVYTSKTGQTVEEITEMMNAETWLFGQEIIDAGFADRMNEPVESSDPVNKVVSLAAMKTKYADMKKRQKELSKDDSFDKQRAVACLKITENNKTMETPGKPDEINKPVQTGKSKTEVPKVKDKAELKKELPDVYDEVLNDGVIKEREENKTRMSGLAEMKASEDYKDIPEAVTVIEASMVDGSSIQSTETKISAAMVKLMKKPGKIDEIESPVQITGGNADPVMKTEKQREV